MFPRVAAGFVPPYVTVTTGMIAKCRNVHDTFRTSFELTKGDSRKYNQSNQPSSRASQKGLSPLRPTAPHGADQYF